jgi:sterol 3beta-glucosyltransferase
VRILIAAVGSRGDVAPLTGLGAALRGAGHDVSLAAYGTFEPLITGCGLGFRLVPGDPKLLGASEQGSGGRKAAPGR